MCDGFDYGQSDECGDGYFNEASFQTIPSLEQDVESTDSVSSLQFVD